MDLKTIDLTLHFKSYIATPYWVERGKLIDIQKVSGMNVARSDAKRKQNLAGYLQKIGMTDQEYNDLEKLASRPWHRNHDGQIIIPAERIMAALVHSADIAPRTLKIDKNNIRCWIQSTDFVTTKTEKDRLWERLVPLKNAAGMPLSSQKKLVCDEVIEDFDAVGTLTLAGISEEKVMDLLKYCGQLVGIGTARNMGHGRFIVRA